MLAVVDLVSWSLICLIATIGVGTLLWAAVQRREAFRRLAEAGALLDGVTAENLYDSRAAIAQSASRLPDVTKAAWREFDETLVSDDAVRRVWNTVEAEQFFNERRFAPRLVGNRLLDAVPTFLTTLGLVGTFVGLAVGLNAIDLDGSADAMKGGIAALVRGAGVGFRASLVGVGASLLANLLLKWMERGVARKALRLQSQIDALFELRSPEQSLTTIAAATQDSAAALAELHEKIGAKLQETMGSALQDLTTRAGDHSAEVFERVGDLLTDAFRDLGTRVADELTRAAETMTSTIGYMGDQLANQADQYAVQMAELQAATARQVELLEEKLPAVVESIDQAAARIGTASEEMAESSANLSTTASWFEETSGRFNATLVSSVEIFDRLAARNDEASAALETLATRMVELGTSTSEAADGLRESAALLSTGFATMRENQESFLADQDARLTHQLDSLTASLGAQSEQMSQWLREYSVEVATQTGHRMSQWNEQTEKFTSTMIIAVQGLNSVVDELDAWMTKQQYRNVEPDAA